jgi:hypothetical protein
LLAICLAGFRVPAGKPASQSASSIISMRKQQKNFKPCRLEGDNTQ